MILTCGKEIGYKMTAEALKGKITSKTKALVLNTPNNPTGAIYTKDELKAIGDLAVAYDFYICLLYTSKTQQTREKLIRQNPCPDQGLTIEQAAELSLIHI